MLYPILGAYLDGLVARKEAAPRRWAIASAALLVVLAAIAVGHAATGYGKLLFPAAFAHGDPTLEAVAWTPLRTELKARGYLGRSDMFVIARTGWMPAGSTKRSTARCRSPCRRLGRGQELRLQRQPEIMARPRRSDHRPHDHAGSRGALAAVFPIHRRVAAGVVRPLRNAGDRIAHLARQEAEDAVAVALNRNTPDRHWRPDRRAIFCGHVDQ